MSAGGRRDGSWVPVGVDIASERTIARNIYKRLLLARKAEKSIATKALKGRSVSFASVLQKDWILRPQRGAFYQHFHGSLSDQNLLRVIYGRWDGLRTKITESLTRIFAPAVSRCTDHSLKLIATVYGNQKSVR